MTIVPGRGKTIVAAFERSQLLGLNTNQFCSLFQSRPKTTPTLNGFS
jgi:hypothetical protein